MTPPLWILEYVKRELTRRSEEGAKKAAEKVATKPPPKKKKSQASKPDRPDRATETQVQETKRWLMEEKGFRDVVLPPHGTAYFSQGDPRWAKIPFPKWKKDPATGKWVAVYEFAKLKKDPVTKKRVPVMEKDPVTGEMVPVMETRTLRSGGCGPTSLAIAIATLRPESGLTPTEVAEFAIEKRYSGRVGSSGARMSMVDPLTEKYGLASETIKADDAQKIDKLKAGLHDGGVAVVHVGPGIFNYPDKDPNKKPSGGHWIAVIGYAVDKDGNEWFFVANPGKDGSVKSLPDKGLIVDEKIDHHGAGMVRVSRETLEGLMKETHMISDPQAPPRAE
jgi:hypothetical protein